jgi:hypothetical protein
VTPEGIARKLIAILSADVKDYTRLMSQDDVGTIRTLTAHKEAMEVLVKRYRGQVVDATGDNLLVRFDSVLVSRLRNSLKKFSGLILSPSPLSPPLKGGENRRDCSNFPPH